jgi:hypothetical protein
MAIESTHESLIAQGYIEGTDAWFEALTGQEFGPEIIFEEGEYTFEEMRRWTSEERASAERAWGKEPGSIAIDIQVVGVEKLARNFETLSARAHKTLLPAVVRDSANRLNRDIVEKIPVGPRGREGDTGGWKKSQARIFAEFIAAGERDATTYAVPLPTHEVLGLREEAEQTIFYPWAVEYGTSNMVAQAPIRSAVNAEGDREFRQMGRLIGKGFVGLARTFKMGEALTQRQLAAAEKLDVAIGPTPEQFNPV